MKNIDQYRGCLVGGAAGDALGYEVEFLSADHIFSRYGEKGITEYTLHGDVARISDDTQMTLFTANGLLSATTNDPLRGTPGIYAAYIRSAYRDWYRTQTAKPPLPAGETNTWLVNVPSLFASRAPGVTCMSALSGQSFGTPESPINNSKGCGGVMRVAPIGLYFDEDTYGFTPEQIDRIGAEAAALTHGHSLGYIPAAALVHIIHLLVYRSVTVAEAVEDMKASISRQFAGDEHLNAFLALTDRAIELAADGTVGDLDAIRELGEGWVAEETLAIAVYCSLKYSRDFEKALIAAVNHSGDSDSTGAVTGNILGAYLGLEGIPSKFTRDLELRRVLLEIADDLYRDRPMTEPPKRDAVWETKYRKRTYRPKYER